MVADGLAKLSFPLNLSCIMLDDPPPLIFGLLLDGISGLLGLELFV